MKPLKHPHLDVLTKARDRTAEHWVRKGAAILLHFLREFKV
jgi:hypothetical protein